MRKLILGSVVAATLAGAALPAAARSSVDFYVNIGPPPAYHEYVPAHRPGWIWVPGYWDWRQHRHHWVGGHWVRHRHGHHYAPARWRHHGDRYYYDRPGWRRDRDGDGVPNRWDRAPSNPWYR